MEILPVNDLDSALHDFVNKDEKMAFYSCLQYNLDEIRVSTITSYIGMNFQSFFIRIKLFDAAR